MTSPLSAIELLEAMKEVLAKYDNHPNITIGFDRYIEQPQMRVPTGAPPILIIPIKDHNV
jgi:hypothetical protein